MSERKHADRLRFAQTLAQRSPDPSTKVGAVLYSSFNVSVGLGWNSFPSNMNVDSSYYTNRELKYDRIIHAEMRALLQAGDHANGGLVYTSLVPCKHCAKHICDTGVNKVYIPASCMTSDWVKRFSAEVHISMQLFAECDVQVIEVEGV